MEFGSGFWHRFELRKSNKEASVVEISAQENVVYIRSSERGGKPKLKKQVCNSSAEGEVALRKHIADLLKLGYEHIESKF